MQSFSIPALPDIRSPAEEARHRLRKFRPRIPSSAKIAIFAPYGNKRGIHNRDFEPLRRLVALQRRTDVRLLRHGRQPHGLRIGRGACRRRRLEPAGKARRDSRRRPRKPRNRAVRPPSALHLYRTPYAAGRQRHRRHGTLRSRNPHRIRRAAAPRGEAPHQPVVGRLDRDARGFRSPVAGIPGQRPRPETRARQPGNLSPPRSHKKKKEPVFVPGLK